MAQRCGETFEKVSPGLCSTAGCSSGCWCRSEQSEVHDLESWSWDLQTRTPALMEVKSYAQLLMNEWMSISSPVVNNFGSLFTVKGLRVHDVFKLVYSLRGKLHMCCQVTVEETDCVAVERQADREATFVTLRDKGEKTQEHIRMIFEKHQVNTKLNF